MKKYLSIILTFSFIFVAVFGFFAMNNATDSVNACIANTSGNPLPCVQSNPIEAAKFHLSVFKGFSSATFLDISTIFALSLLFALAVISLSATYVTRYFYLFSFYYIEQKAVSTQDRRYWQSLHENSPNNSL